VRPYFLQNLFSCIFCIIR